MSADTTALAREELRRGIAATIRLWAEARAKYDDARDVDNEGDSTVARLERVTRDGGRADG